MENSKIAWTHHTFNPWIGCTKVHEGCQSCYAEALSKRTGRVKWGPNGTRSKTKNWREPLKWNRNAEQAGERRRVFCASLADIFEDWKGDIIDHLGRRLWVDRERPGLPPDGYMYESAGYSFAHCRPARMSDLRSDLFKLIDATPNLDWMLLTKRPENVKAMWPCPVCLGRSQPGDGTWGCDHCDGNGTGSGHRDNVWLGYSASNQKTLQHRIRDVHNLTGLGPVIFLSCEPLLGPIDFFAIKADPPNSGFAMTNAFGCDLDDEGPWINLAIVGNESAGPRAGSLGTFETEHHFWNAAEAMLDQCAASGVAFFTKQLPMNGMTVHEVEQFPPKLQVRQMPSLTRSAG
jgi:protein gp37